MPNHIHLILLFEDAEVITAYMRDFIKFTSGEIRREIEKQGRVDIVEKIKYKTKTQLYKVWKDMFDDFLFTQQQNTSDKNELHSSEPCS